MEKEMIDQPGLVSVEKELFAPEMSEETQEGVETVVTEEQPVAAQTVEQPVVETKPEGVQVVEPEKQPAVQQTPEGQAPRMYADKFKTEEELKFAFINLGGNPNRYTTIEKLEEAYEVRQQEFTRSRQEIQTQERLRKGAENNNGNSTPGQPGNPLDSEALLDQVNWEKVENARDLGRELLAIMSKIAPKSEPNLPSEEELVERMMPIMQEREARANELRALETDIPRLRITPGQENPFRDAFARHLMAEKQSGSYVSLKKSMTNFLNWGKEIAEEANRQTGIQKDNKIGAAPLSDRGTGLPTGGPVDEIDSIIGSYKERKNKLGEL